MNKKNILIIIYRGSAEIDWILPVLYKLSSEYNIFTLFNNKKAYESLKKMINYIKFGNQSIFHFMCIQNMIFLYKLLRKILNTIKWKFADKINDFFF